MNVTYILSDGKERKLDICIDGLGLKDENGQLSEKGIYLRNGFFTQTTLVPDVERYHIQVKNMIASRFDRSSKDIDESPYSDSLVFKHKSSIILVLESPHKKEYDDKYISELHPIAPALGSSGINIRKYIELHIQYAVNKGLLTNGEYPLIIMNPIQWQTSLIYFYKGRLNKTIRNRTWKALWRQSHVRSDFLKRIKAYQPVLVINACTGKNDGSVYRPQDTLHNMIMCYLCKNLRDCKIMSTYHPARASNFKNTTYHRIVQTHQFSSCPTLPMKRWEGSMHSGNANWVHL